LDPPLWIECEHITVVPASAFDRLTPRGVVLDKDARLAFALAVLWSYNRSWIAPVHDTFIPTKK